jgi:hypothetical protein
VILGFVVGGGFGVHEDALAGRQVAAGFDAVGWAWLFPTFQVRPSPFVLAHAGWGALIGLGIGAASLLRRHRIAALVLAAQRRRPDCCCSGSWPRSRSNSQPSANAVGEVEEGEVARVLTLWRRAA